MTEDMIVYPGVQALKEEIEKLRTELSMLVLERDELRYVVCKNIKAAYLLEFRTLDYKIYEAECTLLRLKREIELIQARKNRREPVVMFDIEITLDFEFAAYQARLDEETAKINEAVERNRRPVLAEDEAKELKRLYRKIVKELHPDLHPGVTGERLRLFYNAVAAYENGDLEALRMIDGLLSGPDGTVTPSEKSVAALEKERDRLAELVAGIRAEIEAIKSEYPYTLKELVTDSAKKATRRTELEALLRQYEKAIEVYRLLVHALLGSNHISLYISR